MLSPKEPTRGRTVLLAIVLLAVFVRLVHLLHVVDGPLFALHLSFQQSDMYMFDQWARRIAAGDLLGLASYQPLNDWQLLLAPESQWRQWWGEPLVFYKAPLYAYLVGALRALFGEPMLPLALLQIAAAGAYAALTLRIAARLFGERAGFLAGIVHALYAPDIHFDVLMLRGPLIVLVSLLATERLLAFAAEPGPGKAAVCGALTGVALILNESFFSVPPLVLLGMAWSVKDMRRWAIAAAAFLAGLAVGFAPVAVRNMAVGVAPWKLAVTGSTVYGVFNAAGTNPLAFEIRPAAQQPVIVAGGGSLTAVVRACLASFDSPADVGKFYAKKTLGLVVPHENTDNVSFYYAALKDPLLRMLPGYGALFPLGVLGMALAARKRAPLWPLLPFALSILVSILTTIALSRYRATLAVFLMPFAGHALARGVEWLRERRVRALLGLVAASFGLFGIARLAEARVVFAGEAAALRQYRPAEFFLGADFYARQRRYALAAREVEELARLNPDPEIRASALRLAGEFRERLR